MSRFIIKGGKALHGSIRVSGSKNAALPIIFSTLATDGVSRLYNLPDISDVRDALSIVEEYGAKITFQGGSTIIDSRSVGYITPSVERVRRIRASTYLIGACLSRFGRAELMPFGGCAFSVRPIDIHLDAARKLGAVIDGNTIIAEDLAGAEINLRLPSVGATVNALIMAAGAKGRTTIRGAAREPHVLSLISYLKSAGAGIRRQGDVITVEGGKLHGGTAVIPGDMIEAGSFLAASILTDGRVSVSGFEISELSAFTSPLVRAGVIEDLTDGAISLIGRARREISVATAAYPGFATDLHPILATVLAVSSGGTIKEQVWPSRFGYLDELAKLGLSYRREGNVARIFPSLTIPGRARATDLRGGMAAVLLGLCADGESIIDSGELVLRGYDSLTEKLSSLGAEISLEE